MSGGRAAVAATGVALVLCLTGSSLAVADEDLVGSGAADPTEPTGDPTTPDAESAEPAEGLQYGGRALGPSMLPVLPSDPDVTVPAPPRNGALPDQVDAVAPWSANVVCDPVDKPVLEAFATLLSDTYGRPVHSTSRPCAGLRSEHYDGRALDWPLDAGNPKDRRVGDSFATWLTDNDGEMARRLGIQSVIWNAHMWQASTSSWTGYAGQSLHTDHMHFSFSWDGAMMRTSWWTGVPVTEPDLGPCAVVAGSYAAIPQAPRTTPCQPGMVAPPQTEFADVSPGGSGAGVSMLQKVIGQPVTGVLDEATRSALLTWQREAGVPATGVADQLTYAAATDVELPELPRAAFAVPTGADMRTDVTGHEREVLSVGSDGASVKLLQEALDIPADGIFGDQTAQALSAFTADHPWLATSDETTPLTWLVLERQLYPTLPFRHLQLQVGDDNDVVKVAQEQLDVQADGIFGPGTEAAVAAAQQQAGLEPTGIVDGPTWAAIDRGVSAAVGPVPVERLGGTGLPWTERD